MFSPHVASLFGKLCTQHRLSDLIYVTSSTPLPPPVPPLSSRRTTSHLAVPLTFRYVSQCHHQLTQHWKLIILLMHFSSCFCCCCTSSLKLVKDSIHQTLKLQVSKVLYGLGLLNICNYSESVPLVVFFYKTEVGRVSITIKYSI